MVQFILFWYHIKTDTCVAVKLAALEIQKFEACVDRISKIVLDVANMCVNFNRMNCSRLTLAVKQFQTAGKINQVRPLERLQWYIETKTGLKATDL
jgi:hypothetical protein